MKSTARDAERRGHLGTLTWAILLCGIGGWLASPAAGAQSRFAQLYRVVEAGAPSTADPWSDQAGGDLLAPTPAIELAPPLLAQRVASQMDESTGEPPTYTPHGLPYSNACDDACDAYLADP
ncbi:MAG: hypothetical protein GTO03_17615, partial [Planctomycetales bacterium]|nr:hypothetical protein [Planctomycetales bacterium]